MARLSQYTHITPINEGFIYYNSARGSDSMLVLKTNYKEKSLNDAASEEIMLLHEHGHIVNNAEEDYETIRAIQNRFDNQDYLSLVILPNEECNFRCVYCYETMKHRVMNESTQDSILEFVKKNLPHYKSLQVAWFGGEPLLSVPTIEKMSQAFIQICHELKKSFIASITTNGYLLDLETFRILKKCHITHFQITIDGNKEIHDLQRPLHNGDGTFDRIIENLKTIKENVKSHTFEIMLRTNCSKQHLNIFDLYLDDLSQNFGNDPRFSILLRPVMDWGGNRVNQYKEQMFSVENLRIFMQIYMEAFQKKALPKYAVTLEPLQGVCYAGYKNTFVFDSSGAYFRCTCDFDNKRDSKLGMISANGVIFTDRERTRLWNSDISNRREQCDTCELLPLCLGDQCPGYRLIGHDSHGGCPFEKYLLDEHILLAWTSKSKVAKENTK